MWCASRRLCSAELHHHQGHDRFCGAGSSIVGLGASRRRRRGARQRRRRCRRRTRRAEIARFMTNSKLDALTCPREVAEPLSAEVRKQLKTFKFREPYRIDRVQSFGEKRAFRRMLSRLCRSRARSSNEKSLLLLGLVARELIRRTRDLGQTGGESGIRTHGTVSRTHAFQACALSHSAISPDPLS